MRSSLVLLAVCLSFVVLACKRTDPITLQPTIEEPPSFTTTVRVSDASSAPQLLRGFYPAEEAGAWRWTGPRFTVALKTPPGARQKGAALVLAFHLPDATVNALKSITLTASLGPAVLEPETFAKAGEYMYRRDVPASALANDVVNVDFQLDKFFKPQNDNRELGLIVTSIGLDLK